MVYRQHGHKPSDVEIEKLGYKAFGPTRPAFVPTPDDWQAAARDVATGDPDELADVAEELADLWPERHAAGWGFAFPGYPGYGFWMWDDDWGAP